jgi:hypothetical protein
VRLIFDKKKSCNFFIGLLFIFLIIFPKGGIKINNIPLTWGYLILALLSLALLVRSRYMVKKQHVFILLSLIPFQIYSFISIWLNGIENIGFTISFFLGFFILPLIFLFIFSQYIEDLNLDFFSKIFKKSLFLIALFGIFLFFYRIITNSFFEIPFLTINFHDRGLIETMKFNDRGFLLKLTSTYNNGNLYGVCILMFLPLFNLLEKNNIKKAILKLSLLLTLSRTVWIGLIISEFFYAFFINKNKSLSLIKFLISSCIFITIMLFLGKIMNWDIDKYLDPTLGNRLNSKYYDVHLLSIMPFKHIEEMLYNSILKIFGITGIVFFIFGFFSPIIIFLIKLSKGEESSLNKSIFFGLLTYLIASISDSAILYIPTLVIYWFLASFLMSANDFTQKLSNLK